VRRRGGRRCRIDRVKRATLGPINIGPTQVSRSFSESRTHLCALDDYHHLSAPRWADGDLDPMIGSPHQSTESAQLRDGRIIVFPVLHA
jgi:hypothetical protein